jgi:hypothetical protein
MLRLTLRAPSLSRIDPNREASQSGPGRLGSERLLPAS